MAIYYNLLYILLIWQIIIIIIYWSCCPLKLVKISHKKKHELSNQYNHFILKNIFDFQHESYINTNY
jgi:hypothetical protein